LCVITGGSVCGNGKSKPTSYTQQEPPPPLDTYFCKTDGELTIGNITFSKTYGWSKSIEEENLIELLYSEIYSQHYELFPDENTIPQEVLDDPEYQTEDWNDITLYSKHVDASWYYHFVYKDQLYHVYFTLTGNPLLDTCIIETFIDLTEFN
jgi:hypothetical protein